MNPQKEFHFPPGQFTTRRMFGFVAVIAVCLAAYKAIVLNRIPKCDAVFDLTNGQLGFRCHVSGSTTSLYDVLVFDEVTGAQLWSLHMPSGVKNGGTLSTADRSTIPHEERTPPAEEVGSLTVGNGPRHLRVCFGFGYTPLWLPVPSGGFKNYYLDCNDGKIERTREL